jgi:hypothetical protein
MEDVQGLVGAIVLATLVPDCVSALAGFGTVLLAAALVLTGWLLGRLMRAVRAKLGYPDPSETRGPPAPGHTVQDVAARLRHDSPGGWTAGETRWTMAHEHGWYSSRDYKTFLYVVFVVVLSWAFGIHFARQFCA